MPVYVEQNHLAVHLKRRQWCSPTMFQYKLKIKRKKKGGDSGIPD